MITNRERRAIESHIESLSDPEKGPRAEGRLVRYGSRAVEQLLIACNDSNPQVRFRAVLALGKIGDRRAFETVLSLTNDKDEQVKYDALRAIGNLQDERAIPRLIDELKGDFSEPASYSLIQLGGKTLEPVRDLLRGPLKSAAFHILAGIAPAEASELISPFLNDPDELVRINAQDALDTIESSHRPLG